VRSSTFVSYQNQIRLYLVPKLGRIELAKLTPQQVRACFNEMMESGLSPRTVQYNRAILRRALSQAVRDGMVPRNVVALTDAPKVPHYEIQPYTPEQARLFLEAVKGDRLEALFTVAVAIGMRQGEILSLRWHVNGGERRGHFRGARVGHAANVR
jgi:integrase